MKDKKLIIYGVGKFTDFICYSFMNDSDYTIIAQCVEGNYLSKANETEHEYPLVNFDNLEETFLPEDFELFITVGDDKIRERIYETAKKKHYKLATYISTSSIVPKNLITGDNVYIGEKTGIQPFVEIKDNTFIIGANIGHHCKIGKNSILSVCTLGAEVMVGDNCFIGLNATIRPRITIGAKNIIGMNCSITSNTTEKSIFNQPSSKKRALSYDDLKGRYL